MTEIKIDWGHGSMIINIERVFPCNINKAKRLCHLINQYSNEEDKSKLRDYLKKCAEELKTKAEEPNHTKASENDYHRCVKNLEFLNTGGHNDERLKSRIRQQQKLKEMVK